MIHSPQYFSMITFYPIGDVATFSHFLVCSQLFSKVLALQSTKKTVMNIIKTTIRYIASAASSILSHCVDADRGMPKFF